MTINYDTDYKALQRANEIAEEKLEIFNRAILALQQEAEEAEGNDDRQHVSSIDPVAR